MRSAAEARDSCPIVRTHQRFLLRSLVFTQQYAPMYRCRLETQAAPALRAIQRIVKEYTASSTKSVGSLEPRRVLELLPGVPAICVGVIYKNMKMLPRFLDEYQRELVRIDAGDEDNDDDGGGGAVEPVPLDTKDAIAGLMDEEGELSRGGQTLAAANEDYSVCNVADELMLEDSSGRVLLQGMDPDRFCTGVVLGIYGTLLANGSIEVIRYAFAGDLHASYVPRLLPRVAGSAFEPCYIAFVSGLSINLPRNSSMEEHAAVAKARASLELLVDFLCGNTSNAALRRKAKHISRVVIGGDSIAPTDELKLKKKVKLDPSDHVRLSDKAQAGSVTSAALMRELDAVLERVVSSVEVEMMPGDNDMSDAFQPQQPLHPVLLPKAAKHSTLRLVSNPFCFTALPPACVLEGEAEEESDKKKHKPEVSNGVNVFVTSGQNINDVARETRFPTRLHTMGLVIESGCACPTAPNTLFSYPFCKFDPFLFQRTPHCMVACDQPRFETRFATLEEMYEETHHSYTNEEAAKQMAGSASTKNEEGETNSAETGVRLICVPSFARSGALVLMDVNSPTLEATVINFSVQ